MTKHANLPPDRSEWLSRELYRELGAQGWTIPKSEREVRAAEEWLAKNPVRVPDRLSSRPEKDVSGESRELLSRDLRDEGRDRTIDDQQAKDDRSDRDLERD